MNPSSERQFEMQIDIQATREEVWDAIASSRGLSSWFARDAELEPGVGGKVVWSWGDLYHWEHEIEVWQPGERLRTRYDASVKTDSGQSHPLFVDFILESDKGHTTLRLVHSGFGNDSAFDEEYNGISRGWPVELRSLRLYLELHTRKQRQVTWSIGDIEGTPQQAWQRLMGPDGFGCNPPIDQLGEGDSFQMHSSSGDVFEGEVLFNQERDFCGVVHSHGNGFLRLAVENCGKGYQAWLWLATYDQGSSQSTELQTRWDDMRSRLYQTEQQSIGS